MLTAGTYRAAPRTFAAKAVTLLTRPGVLAEAGGWLRHQLVELLRVLLPELPEVTQLALWEQVWQLPIELRWEPDSRPAEQRRLAEPASRVYIGLEEARHLHLSVFPPALLTRVSAASRRAWLTLERRRETPRNRKPREYSFGSGAPSPLRDAQAKNLRTNDWLKAFKKHQNLTGERR